MKWWILSGIFGGRLLFERDVYLGEFLFHGMWGGGGLSEASMHVHTIAWHCSLSEFLELGNIEVHISEKTPSSSRTPHSLHV